MQKPLIEWTAPEFEYRPKGVSWYWLTLIGAIFLVGLAVWQRNFLFCVFVVIAEILVLAWAGKEPRDITFTINEREILIDGGQSVRFADIKSFSVNEDTLDEDWPDLHIHLERRLRPVLRIKIPRERSEEVRAALATHTKEHQFEPSIADAIEKLLRF